MDELKIWDLNIAKETRINRSLATDKKLIVDDDYSLYLKIQSLYLKVLEKYLESKIDLKKYDDIINNSELDFGEIPEKYKRPFHKISYLNLNHIYIRNFLFIEKLSNEALNIFINKISANDFSIDDNLLMIVVNTYKEIIKNNYAMDKYQEKVTTVYDSFVPENVLDSNQLVITIQTGIPNNNLTGDEFVENRHKQSKLLEEISNSLVEDIKNNLGIDSKILIRNVYGS